MDSKKLISSNQYQINLFLYFFLDRIVIVSDEFKNKFAVQRHRMIYALIDDEFKNGLHAINMITQTPEEYEKSKINK